MSRTHQRGPRLWGQAREAGRPEQEFGGGSPGAGHRGLGAIAGAECGGCWGGGRGRRDAEIGARR